MFLCKVKKVKSSHGELVTVGNRVWINIGNFFHFKSQIWIILEIKNEALEEGKVL